MRRGSTSPKKSIYKDLDSSEVNERIKGHGRNIIRSNNTGNGYHTTTNGGGNKSVRITPDTMSRKQEALLKNRLKNLVNKNKLDDAFGKDEITMQKKFEALGEFDEKKELHETLKDLRSKYDSMVEECNKKEMKLKKIQDEIASIQLQKDKILKEEKQCEDNLQLADSNLKQVQVRLQEVSATKRTYEFMLDRVKRDHLINQKNSVSVDRKIEKDESAIEKNRELLIKRKREESETKHAINVINQRIKSQKDQREEELDRLKEIFNKRKEMEMKRQNRIEKQKEVAENAITQNKDLNEQKWRRLLLVHKFFAFFLKKKMDRELKRFSTVEDAYRRIKATTGISEPDEIVKKYFSREKSYSELLLSIAKAEKKLDALKKEYEVISEDKKILKEEMLRLEKLPQDPRRADDVEKSKEVKLIEDLTRKISEKKLEKKMITEWLGKMYEKLIAVV